ncbi:MAG: heat-inducible transcriptional repressor HrcA [Clostridia bacterium]
MNLDERKKKILSSVVEDYIESAEPVGSKTLVEKYHLNYSSATIRNDMKILEEEGYLEQPHVSAGRIPSTKGYRYYVDNLMKEKKLSMVDIDYINSTINGFGDVDDIIEQVADVVSKVLSAPTVITKNNTDTIENIKVVKISDNLLLIVLMSKNGTVKDCIAKLTDTVEDTVIDKMTSILNQNLSGTPLQELHYALNNVIKKDLEAFSEVMEQIVNSIKYEMSKNMRKLNSGVEKIFENPEFSDVETVKNFINMISTKEIIDSALDRTRDNKLSIVIGSENKEVLLNDYTVISLDIEKDNKYLGKLSVIGPKRMNYAKTISTLKYINEKFNGILKLNKDNSAKGDNSEEGRK